MRKKSIQKCSIVIFCAALMITGLLTIGLNIKTIAKAGINGITSGYASSGNVFGAVSGFISGIDTSVDEGLFLRTSYINLFGLCEKILGKEYIIDANPLQNVIKDNHGQLQFIAAKTDNSVEAEQLASVKVAAEKTGAELLYIQTPLKIIEDYTELPIAIVDYSKENADTFLNQLQEEQISVLDLRENVQEDNLNLSTLFYDTDHHWRTQTAFWAVGETVNYLKENLGLDLDAEGFYTNLDNYKQTLYAKSFLGSQGRRVGRYYGGLDDFTLITPDYDTFYKVTINKTDESIVREGSFADAVLDQSLLTAEDVFTNRYASYFGADYPEVIIENETAPNDTKILIVKDSFALPYSAFLSTMAGETRMLDLRYFTGTVENYIAEYQPDVVLYVYKSINTQK